MTDDKCAFCKSETETHDHLFFDCPFSNRVWRAIKNKCCVNWGDRTWNEWIVFCSNELKGKSLGCYTRKLAFTVTVYSIWRERNNRIFCKELKPEEVVIKDINNLVRDRLLSLRNLEKYKEDNWFLRTWNISEAVFKLA